MGLNKKRLLTALYFSNRIIQRNFPLRTFIAPNVGNSFGAHSFSSANALYLHGVRHPSLPTGALTVAVALLTSRLSSVWQRHAGSRERDARGAGSRTGRFAKDRALPLISTGRS